MSASLNVYLDIPSSLEATNRQNAGGATKIVEDLDRYSIVLEQTRPDVIVECGTWRGGSALWFASQGFDVVTVDINGDTICAEARQHSRITCVTGDSVAPGMVAHVSALVTDRRVMVVLDSDHSPHHVRREIESYGSLVSVGCYLVVEDGVVRWMPSPVDQVTPGPLDALEYLLEDSPEWQRDEEIERMHPVTMHPGGWWIRNAH